MTEDAAMSNFLSIFISSILVNNPLVVLFLGLCSFIGVTKKISEAWSMSVAVVIVTLISQQITFALNYALVYFDVEYLRLLIFIAVIASAVQVIDIVMKKFMPAMHRSFGVYLALITTNCLVLYVALVQIAKGYSYLDCTAFSLGTGFGYLLMMVIMAGIRERLETSNLPEVVKGTAMVVLIASFLSLMMQGFSGIGG